MGPIYLKDVRITRSQKRMLPGGLESFPLYDLPVEKGVAGKIGGSRCCDLAEGGRDFFLPVSKRATILIKIHSFER